MNSRSRDLGPILGMGVEPLVEMGDQVGYRVGGGLGGRHQEQAGLPDGQALVPIFVPVQIEHGDEIDGQIVPVDFTLVESLDQGTTMRHRRAEEVAVELGRGLPEWRLITSSWSSVDHSTVAPVPSCSTYSRNAVVRSGVSTPSIPVVAAAMRASMVRSSTHRSARTMPSSPRLSRPLLQRLANQRNQLSVLVILQGGLGEQRGLQPSALKMLVPRRLSTASARRTVGSPGATPCRKLRDRRISSISA